MSNIDFVCPACNSRDAQHDHTEGRLIKCARCLAEMIWPLPTSNELNAIYSAHNAFTAIGETDVSRYERDPSGKANHAKYVQGVLSKYALKSDATVLEVGCMHGLVILELAKLGYKCFGVDPSPEGIQYLNDHGGTGYQGTMVDKDMPFKHADAVIAFHSFEHMPDPYATLRRIEGLLPVGGILHFAVPNWAGLAAQRERERWKWYAPPFHLHYFTQESLIKILVRMRFKVLSFSSIAGDEEIDQMLANDRLTDEAERRGAKKFLNQMVLGEQLVVTAVRTPEPLVSTPW